jgi:2-methylisocitrate lyase-like PEP mutase family enzyme
MDNKFEAFAALHKSAAPLLIGNAWDAASAKAFEKQGFKAVGTSSAAVAAALGYNDGEEMALEEYLLIVRRIVASVTVPVTVDLEGGYGKSAEAICQNIRSLYNLGVAGINIEDSVIREGNRIIQGAEDFAQTLKRIIQYLQAENIRMFINVRSDSFLLGLPDALNDAVKRVSIYERAGVHGLFFPCVVHLPEIKTLTQATHLPINVMCMPNLPSFEDLRQAGVSRISIGPFLFNKVYHDLETLLTTIDTNGSFQSLFA